GRSDHQKKTGVVHDFEDQGQRNGTVDPHDPRIVFEPLAEVKHHTGDTRGRMLHPKSAKSMLFSTRAARPLRMGQGVKAYWCGRMLFSSQTYSMSSQVGKNLYCKRPEKDFVNTFGSSMVMSSANMSFSMR